MVQMHKDLLRGGDNCVGGGYYEFDYISAKLILSSKSYDFGYPQWSRIESLSVPAYLEGLSIVYRRAPKEEETRIADLMPIKYY